MTLGRGVSLDSLRSLGMTLGRGGSLDSLRSLVMTLGREGSVDSLRSLVMTLERGGSLDSLRSLGMTRLPAASPRRTIAIVDDLQSLQRQLWIDLVDVFAVVDEERGQAAGRDHAFDSTHFTFDARENSVDECEISEIQTRLHVDDRVRADDMRRSLDVDARQAGSAREQRFG